MEGENPASLPTDFTELFVGRSGDNTSINGFIDEFGVFAGALQEFEIKALADGASALQIKQGTLPDSDGDGMPDAYETEFGLDSSADDAEQDADDDGLANLAEFEKGTHPKMADTDGDGLDDGLETGTGEFVGPEDTGTDPTKADSDGDGLADGVETATGEFVGENDTGTDPNNSDTDGDGLADGVETGTDTFVSLDNTGSNPVKADTDGDGVADKEELLARFDPNFPESKPQVEAKPDPQFTDIKIQGDKLVIEWTSGTLQAAEKVAGPYEDMSDARSPQSIPLKDDMRFFRLKE